MRVSAQSRITCSEDRLGPRVRTLSLAGPKRIRPDARVRSPTRGSFADSAASVHLDQGGASAPHSWNELQTTPPAHGSRLADLLGGSVCGAGAKIRAKSRWPMEGHAAAYAAAYGRRRIAAAPRAGRGAVMSGDLAWRPWDRTRRIQGPAGGEVGWFHLVWLD